MPDETRAEELPAYARLKALAARPEPPMAYGPRFGLVVPPSPYVVPTGWEFVHEAPFEGPSVIAALLRSMGFAVRILDQRDRPDPRALAGGPLHDVDILGIATYSDSFPWVRAVTEIARAERRDRTIVLGGPTVTSAPRTFLESTAADLAVLGEGELTLIELADRLLERPGAPELAEIPGLAWKDADGRATINAPRPQMRDLDPVPFQDLEAWPRVRETGRAPEIFLQHSRGCPLSCSFCYRAMPRLAWKSPGRVRAELDRLRPFGYRFIWWNDLTFVADRRRVTALLDALEGLDARWSAFTRVVGIDPEILSRMRERGCDIVLYGFESITREILDSFGKGARPTDVSRAIEITRQAGLKVGGLFIIGAPGETEESLESLVRFCERFREVTRVKYLSLLPGTKEYRDALARGIIRSELEHLRFLARERSVEDDEIINVSGVPDELLRKVYRAVNRCIEVRPYEYWNPANRFLETPTRFRPRPLPGGGSGAERPS